MTLCSAITVTHDRRRFVPDAIACFLAQTLADIDLVVVDDGEDSVSDLVPVHARIHYVRMAPKHHVCELRDVAMACTSGRYVATWDDDDISHPERLSVQIEALESSGKSLCLLGSSIVTQEEPPGRWVYAPPAPWPLDNSAVLRVTGGFHWHVDDTIYTEINALKAAFADDLVVVQGRPQLLITRRHSTNNCQRPCGQGPEWTKISD